MLVLSFVCLSGLVQSTAAGITWTAYVGTSYRNSSTNQTVESFCECGVYGASSPVKSAMGTVVLPASDPTGCDLDPYPFNNNTASEGAWIALVKRGNCTFDQKIKAAQARGAAAVVIYNVDGTGRGTSVMTHPDAPGVVSIMIGNLRGTEIVNLVQRGVDVSMLIGPHVPWMDAYWLYFLSIAFFIVTGASIVYFLFVSVHRLHGLRATRIANRRLKNQAKKAISRLEVRRLKQGDEEIQSDSHTCAVCIESYHPGDVVTVLTCGHLFHKACIEPWLLDKRTCPMCKADILKALGVEGCEGEEESRVSSCPPPDVTVVTVSGGLGEEPLFDVPLNDDRTPAPDRPVQAWQPHHYDNMAFVEETHPHGNMTTRG
ncbi:E3 ubiquitin-protein ligase RNF128-like [Esox lucius]|uniref:RING-type domain-containing protein n=1 Tax=Esox lucius TaxID=8010 RepID=A0A3P8XGU5_ESOLU|nr:E3 ubiquitin-protein ligase RNF128-like [Esox lucius]